MQQTPPSPLVRRGGGFEIGEEEGMARRERHWRCTGDEMKMINVRLSENSMKNFKNAHK